MPDLTLRPRSLVQRLPVFPRQRSSEPRDPRGIRRRREGDLAACARLAGLSVAATARQPSWRAWLTSDDVVDAWVVERHGELLGHVAVSEVGGDALSAIRWRELTGHPTADLLAVSRLFVRPRVRGQGLGAALLETAVAAARGRGRIPVAEVVGGGPDELRLYERAGCRPIGLCPARLRPDGLETRFLLLASAG